MTYLRDGDGVPDYQYYVDNGGTFLKVPWVVNGANSSQAGETVQRYERLAWGEEEQGECQLKDPALGPSNEVVPWSPGQLQEVFSWFPRLVNPDKNAGK